MDMKQVILGIISISVVAIIAVAGIPIIMDTSDNIKISADNDIEGKITYAIGTPSNLDISVGDGVIDVGGYSIAPNTQTILASCNDWCVFTFNTSSIFVLKSDGYDTVKSGTDAVISNNVLTYTKSDDTSVEMNVVGQMLYATNANPTYVREWASSFNMDAGVSVWFFGNPQLMNDGLSPSTLSLIAYGSGTPNNLGYRLIAGDVLSNNISFDNMSESDGYLTASTLYSATITNDVGTYTSASAQYSTYVPIEYHEIDYDNNVRAIFNIIPLVIIVSLVILAIGVFIKRM